MNHHVVQKLSNKIFNTYLETLGYEKSYHPDIDFINDCKIMIQYINSKGKNIYIGVDLKNGDGVAYIRYSNYVCKHNHDLVEIDYLFYKVLLDIDSKSTADKYLKEVEESKND